MPSERQTVLHCLSTQADACVNTTSKRVTIIILVLISVSKNVLLPTEKLMSAVTFIFIDLERGGGIFFVGSSQKNQPNNQKTTNKQKTHRHTKNPYWKCDHFPVSAETSEECIFLLSSDFQRETVCVTKNPFFHWETLPSSNTTQL